LRRPRESVDRLEEWKVSVFSEVLRDYIRQEELTGQNKFFSYLTAGQICLGLKVLLRLFRLAYMPHMEYICLDGNGGGHKKFIFFYYFSLDKLPEVAYTDLIVRFSFRYKQEMMIQFLSTYWANQPGYGDMTARFADTGIF